MTRPPRALQALIAAAVSGGTVNASKSIWWSSMSSALTGRNVPGPTCSVTATRGTPFASSAAKISGVKWSPAVGAATEPTSRA